MTSHEKKKPPHKTQNRRPSRTSHSTRILYNSLWSMARLCQPQHEFHHITRTNNRSQQPPPKRPKQHVTLIVDNITKTIEKTDPTSLQILINITNSGPTLITKLVINDTLPTDWNLTQQPLIQYHQTDGNTTLIDPAHFIVVYDSTTKTLHISLPDIKTAIGKYLNQNETIFITLNTAYALTGNQLPPEYENNPPTYTNTATAYITSWQSQPTTSTLDFTTNIYWI